MTPPPVLSIGDSVGLVSTDGNTVLTGLEHATTELVTGWTTV